MMIISFSTHSSAVVSSCVCDCTQVCEVYLHNSIGGVAVLANLKKRSCSFSSALLDQCHWILLLLSFGQNLTQPCRCHLQVSRHLRAAAAEMHGLQRRDPPGAGHGPVLAPGPPGQEDHRGPRRPLAATLRATPTRGRRSSARMFTWGTSRGRLAEENPGLPKKTSGSNVFVELILCRMIRGALAPKAANCY